LTTLLLQEMGARGCQASAMRITEAESKHLHSRKHLPLAAA